jgi:hypothetical protein
MQTGCIVDKLQEIIPETPGQRWEFFAKRDTDPRAPRGMRG